MSCFEKTLDDSRRAACREGPKSGRPRVSNTSAIPSASGCSGPTTVTSMAFAAAKSASPSKSDTEMGTFRPGPSVPGFPGATWMEAPGSSRRSLAAIACSRPPLPTISMFMGTG